MVIILLFIKVIYSLAPSSALEKSSVRSEIALKDALKQEILEEKLRICQEVIQMQIICDGYLDSFSLNSEGKRKARQFYKTCSIEVLTSCSGLIFARAVQLRDIEVLKILRDRKVSLTWGGKKGEVKVRESEGEEEDFLLYVTRYLRRGVYSLENYILIVEVLERAKCIDRQSEFLKDMLAVESISVKLIKESKISRGVNTNIIEKLRLWKLRWKEIAEGKKEGQRLIFERDLVESLVFVEKLTDRDIEAVAKFYQEVGVSFIEKENRALFWIDCLNVINNKGNNEQLQTHWMSVLLKNITVEEFEGIVQTGLEVLPLSSLEELLTICIVTFKKVGERDEKWWEKEGGRILERVERSYIEKDKSLLGIWYMWSCLNGKEEIFVKKIIENRNLDYVEEIYKGSEYLLRKNQLKTQIYNCLLDSRYTSDELKTVFSVLPLNYDNINSFLQIAVRKMILPAPSQKVDKYNRQVAKKVHLLLQKFANLKAQSGLKIGCLKYCFFEKVYETEAKTPLEDILWKGNYTLLRVMIKGIKECVVETMNRVMETKSLIKSVILQGEKNIEKVIEEILNLELEEEKVLIECIELAKENQLWSVAEMIDKKVSHSELIVENEKTKFQKERKLSIWENCVKKYGNCLEELEEEVKKLYRHKIQVSEILEVVSVSSSVSDEQIMNFLSILIKKQEISLIGGLIEGKGVKEGVKSQCASLIKKHKKLEWLLNCFVKYLNERKGEEKENKVDKLMGLLQEVPDMVSILESYVSKKKTAGDVKILWLKLLMEVDVNGKDGFILKLFKQWDKKDPKRQIGITFFLNSLHVGYEKLENEKVVKYIKELFETFSIEEIESIEKGGALEGLAQEEKLLKIWVNALKFKLDGDTLKSIFIENIRKGNGVIREFLQRKNIQKEHKQNLIKKFVEMERKEILRVFTEFPDLGQYEEILLQEIVNQNKQKWLYREFMESNYEKKMFYFLMKSRSPHSSIIEDLVDNLLMEMSIKTRESLEIFEIYWEQTGLFIEEGRGRVLYSPDLFERRNGEMTEVEKRRSEYRMSFIMTNSVEPLRDKVDKRVDSLEVEESEELIVLKNLVDMEGNNAEELSVLIEVSCENFENQWIRTILESPDCQEEKKGLFIEAMFLTHRNEIIQSIINCSSLRKYSTSLWKAVLSQQGGEDFFAILTTKYKHKEKEALIKVVLGAGERLLSEEEEKLLDRYFYDESTLGQEKMLYLKKCLSQRWMLNQEKREQIGNKVYKLLKSWSANEGRQEAWRWYWEGVGKSIEWEILSEKSLNQWKEKQMRMYHLMTVEEEVWNREIIEMVQDKVVEVKKNIRRIKEAREKKRSDLRGESVESLLEVLTLGLEEELLIEVINENIEINFDILERFLSRGNINQEYKRSLIKCLIKVESPILFLVFIHSYKVGSCEEILVKELQKQNKQEWLYQELLLRNGEHKLFYFLMKLKPFFEESLENYIDRIISELSISERERKEIFKIYWEQVSLRIKEKGTRLSLYDQEVFERRFNAMTEEERQESQQWWISIMNEIEKKKERVLDLEEIEVVKNLVTIEENTAKDLSLLIKVSCENFESQWIQIILESSDYEETQKELFIESMVLIYGNELVKNIISYPSLKKYSMAFWKSVIKHQKEDYFFELLTEKYKYYEKENLIRVILQTEDCIKSQEGKGCFYQYFYDKNTLMKEKMLCIRKWISQKRDANREKRESLDEKIYELLKSWIKGEERTEALGWYWENYLKCFEEKFKFDKVSIGEFESWIEAEQKVSSLHAEEEDLFVKKVLLKVREKILEVGKLVLGVKKVSQVKDEGEQQKKSDDEWGKNKDISKECEGGDWQVKKVTEVLMRVAVSNYA